MGSWNVTFGSTRLGAVSICDGDIQKGYWDYMSDHRLTTLGNFWAKNLKLKGNLATIRRLEGELALAYIEKGKSALGAPIAIAGAMVGGVVGALVGLKLKQMKGDKVAPSLVCFEAILSNGKRFVAVCESAVFDKIMECNNALSQRK